MVFLLRRLLSDGCFDDTYVPCSPPPFSMPYSIPVPVPVPAGVSHRMQRFTVLALAVSSVLAAFFLLLTYYLLFLRFRANLRRRRNLAPAPAATTPADPPGDDPAGDDGVHHIWYIRTVGLDESTIASIAVAVYKAGDGFVDCSDCSVCLGEFCDGELLRLLPKCSHAFHLPCIDTWLRAHVSCPLCRAPVVSASPQGGDAPQVTGGDPDPPPPLPDSEILGSLPDPGSSSSSPGQPPEELWVTIDLGDYPPPHIRRSVSMDASALEANLADMAGAKALDRSQKEPGGWVERCQSTNGRRFFLPRFATGRNTSILPL